MTVDLKNITKSFGKHVALQDVSLRIKGGTLTSLLGPSGCGKTSLLRIISGLEIPDVGQVFLNDEDITYKQSKIRNIGFVFQSYALFRHLSVYDNVAFGLVVKPRKERLSQAEIESRVHEVLSLVQLDNQSTKFPHQLSGGQQQRVALARVLAIQPRILLLDEPFGALDATVRRDLRRWLRRLHEEIHITTILVTHDQEEALEISDEVALFNHGVLEQVGKPRDIYTSPASSFVYEFLGVVNVFEGRLKDHHLVHFSPDKKQQFMNGSSSSAVYVRPHEFKVRPISQKQENDLEGVIVRVSFVANTVLLEIRLRDDLATLKSAAKDSAKSMGKATVKSRAKSTAKEKIKSKIKIIEASISDIEWEEYNYKVGDSVSFRAKKMSSFS